MSSQNILKYYGSKLSIKLDTSELYDYELSKVDDDYDFSVINFNNLITYDSLKLDVDSSLLINDDKSVVNLVEYDNSINDVNYIYSALTLNIDYTEFFSVFDSFLNNTVFTYTGITDETHLFIIDGYNNPIGSETLSITGFSSSTELCVQNLFSDPTCCSQPSTLGFRPVYYGIGDDFCSPTIKRRTEYGWTLDFVFNKESLPWNSGSTFYYWGILNEPESDNYLDNNLSFSFTDDGRIKWESMRISGFCDTTSGYTTVEYISSGQTVVLCDEGTSDDFNITISFTRNSKYTDCDIPNEGGWNDLITGWTVTNPMEVITGATEKYDIIEVINKKWLGEREKRLGTLKIYLNGKPIYRLKNWEEIVPSMRGSNRPIVQIWGGGTTNSGDLHEGKTQFNLKKFKYFEEPLNFPNIKHHYKTIVVPNYSVVECINPCLDNITWTTSTGLLTEDDYFITSENDDVLRY